MGNIKRQIQKQKLIKATKTVTESFLEAIYLSLEILGTLSTGRYSMYGSLRKTAFSDWSDTKFSKKVNDAVKTGYLRIGPNNSIEFTNKAQLRIMDKIISGKRRDGKNRFLSFDIPEPKRSKRDGFRRIIKRMGFRQIQKSLWVCDKNIGDLVEIAKREYGVEEYVVYVVSEKSDIDDHITNILKGGSQAV